MTKKYFVTTSAGRNGYKIIVEREFDRLVVYDSDVINILSSLPHHFGQGDAEQCLDWLDELPGVASVTVKSRGDKFGVRYTR